MFYLYVHQCKFTTIGIIYVYPNKESWLNIITAGNYDHVEFDEGKTIKIFLCAPYAEVLHRSASKVLSHNIHCWVKSWIILYEICSNFIFSLLEIYGFMTKHILCCEIQLFDLTMNPQVWNYKFLKSCKNGI